MTATQALALLLLIVGSCAIAGLARRHGVAAPILLVLTGLAASYIPGVPEFRLNPDLVLFAVLPPLVYTTALESSYLNLRDNVRTLALLSVGLVLFTAVVVGGAARLDVPGLPVAAAITLGAILAPTDAVTTASIGRQLHLPRRLLTVITGESMLNDGTALTLYAVAVSAAAVSVATPSPLSVARSLIVISAGGIVAGLVLGVLIHRLRMRLRDPLVESALSLLTPFAAYLAADSLHVSGILAVVVTGLYLGHHGGQAHFATRLQDMAVWRVATFVLESVAFALIGLQLRPIWTRLDDPVRLKYCLIAAAVLGAVILTRIAWVTLYGATLRQLIALGILHPRRPEEVPTVRRGIVVSWCGMRGIVTLAAAFALPEGFPYRDLMLLTAFAVVLGSLVIQGLTLRPLISALRLQDENTVASEVGRARAAAYRAALEEIDGDPSEEAEILRLEYRALLLRAESDPDGRVSTGELPADPLRRRAIGAARRSILALRESEVIGDDAFHAAEEELDLLELTTDARIRPGD